MVVSSETRHRMKVLEGRLKVRISSYAGDENVDIAAVAQGGQVRFAALYLREQSVVEVASSYLPLDAFEWMKDEVVFRRVNRDLRKKVKGLIVSVKRRLELLSKK